MRTSAWLELRRLLGARLVGTRRIIADGAPVSHRTASHGYPNPADRVRDRDGAPLLVAATTVAPMGRGVRFEHAGCSEAETVVMGDHVRSWLHAQRQRRSDPARVRPGGIGSVDFPERAWRDRLHARLEVPLVLAALGVPSEKTVLELGCGRGVAIGAIVRACRPSSLMSVEIRPDEAARAQREVRQLGAHATLVAGDICSLPVLDDSVDVVIDFGTCYHVAHPATALQEVQRVLRPRGLFVHETMLSQLVAHPRRSTHAQLPWHAAPQMVPHRSAGLWASRSKAMPRR